MKLLLTALLIALGIFVVLAIGGGLLVLAAYGVGLLLNLVMRIEPLHATLLSLAGMLAFGILVERIWKIIATPPPSFNDEYEDDEDEYDDEDFEDDEFEDEDEEEPVVYPGIPRWRQPLKTPDFSNTKPDDRCPCGSGRKYKNCHGSKQKKI